MKLDVELGSDVKLIFAVPIMASVIANSEATNAALRRLILDMEQADRGKNRSNIGGWHSKGAFLETAAPEIATLKQWIDVAVQRMSRLPSREVKLEYRAYGWANVNRDGDYNNLHMHPRNHWAVVYYVATGEEAPGYPMNGRLELRDPRPIAATAVLQGFNFGQSYMVQPQPGLIVTFPAWIEHWVHPFRGSGERISVAVNVQLTKFRVR